MEDITEVLNNAVTERLEIAYFELIKENEEVCIGGADKYLDLI